MVPASRRCGRSCGQKPEVAGRANRRHRLRASAPTPAHAEIYTAGWEVGGPGTGAVVRVPAHSTTPTLIASGLSFPGGFAAGSNGAIYVSNWSVAPANSGGGPTGEVVRITP